MPKYEVRCVMPVFMTIEVEAEDEDDAIEVAWDYMSLSSFAGNGATHGKLIGTTSSNVTLEAGDYPVEDEFHKIEVEEIDE